MALTRLTVRFFVRVRRGARRHHGARRRLQRRRLARRLRPDHAEGTDPAVCTSKRCNRSLLIKEASSGVEHLFCTVRCDPDAGTGCANVEICYLEPGAPTSEAYCALKCTDERCKPPLKCQANGTVCF
ncbi:MAG: hypothetical protein IPF92_24635 [Myxococcales bacterium]|nr:hypothetical protein [Myxococcales bacterium]